MSNLVTIPSNNAVIIQQAFDYQGSKIFTDMMRLTYQRHAAYAASHSFDYWHIIGSLYPNMHGGAWCKIALIQQALERYEFVAWIDADAAITGDCDLREALPADKSIGACKHDPEKSPYLRQFDIPPHHNVGVTYWRSCEASRAFVAEWFAAHPGHSRWLEQGVFNEMIERPEYAPHFHTCEDAWNATVNVNMVPNPRVTGWHGVSPAARRLLMMRSAFADDHLKFRV